MAPSDGRPPEVWRGRLASGLDPRAQALNDSLAVDKRLWPEELALTRAYAPALHEAGVLSAPERVKLLAAADALETDLASGKTRLEGEDVHSAVEAELTRRCGDPARKLHTGRSRNDQVTTLLRLRVMSLCEEAVEGVRELERSLVMQARAAGDLAVAAYTHLQPAQPVLLAHHLLAYREMLARDRGRFRDCRTRADEMPLGAGALAGAGFALDRNRLARALGFAHPTANSLDAVGDRDAAAEFLAAAAIAAVHLSRLGEEIVLWASDEFGFVDLPDAFATGSSMMPQKKNPDVAELVRGKTGRVIGALVALLTTLKGLPLAYNRDLQEDKAPLFDAADTLGQCLEVLTALVPRLGFRSAHMAAAADGLLLATDLADLLVERGVPFRRAHAIVGGLVRHCLATGTGLRDLDATVLRRHSRLLTPALVRQLTPARSVARRRVVGGTAPVAVRRQLARAAREDAR